MCALMTLLAIFLVIIAVGAGVWFVAKAKTKKDLAKPMTKLEPVAPAPMPERKFPEVPKQNQFPPVPPTPPVPPISSGV